MNQYFALLFYIKRLKMNARGLVPVYLRITIDGERAEVSSKRYVNPAQWSANRQKVTGSGEEARKLNAYLKTLEQEVYEAHRTLMEKKQAVTASGLKDFLLGKTEEAAPGRMLIPVFEEHNRQVRALLGKEYAKGTLDRYETSLKHTRDFLLWKYKMTDIDIKAIDHEFIMAYDFYLRSERNCNNNSTVKYLKNFKKIILMCIASGWLDKDPFVKYKQKVKEVKRAYLSTEELEAMAARQLVSERVGQVRDVFLFSCYTGLAYADVKKLRRSEIVSGMDGQQWIHTSRQKTDSDSRIPNCQRPWS